MIQAIDTSVLEESQPLRLDAVLVEDHESEAEGYSEEQLVTDLNEAIVLIDRSKNLFKFLADPHLCKAISERERKTISKLASSLEEFVSELQGTYEGDENGIFVQS